LKPRHHPPFVRGFFLPSRIGQGWSLLGENYREVAMTGKGKKKTPEEMAEENKRTNEVALFNFADSFLVSAKHLIENPPPERLRFKHPIDFLLFHAAELYLKSYLRQKGEDVDALRKLGHSHRRLCKRAARYGMNIPSEINDIFAFLDETDAVINSRYIWTGPKMTLTRAFYSQRS
jgi:hypothetical protein